MKMNEDENEDERLQLNGLYVDTVHSSADDTWSVLYDNQRLAKGVINKALAKQWYEDYKALFHRPSFIVARVKACGG